MDATITPDVRAQWAKRSACAEIPGAEWGLGRLGAMTRERAGAEPAHTVAADAAMRAETVMADAAVRTRAFGAGAGVQHGHSGDGCDGAGHPNHDYVTDGHCGDGHGRAEGPIPGVVLTISDRSASGEREDTSGPLAAELLAEFGVEAGVHVVPDGEAPVREGIKAAVAGGARVVLTTGGTGVGPRDRTPEGTAPLLVLPLPGLAQAIREHGAGGDHPVREAVLSRGLAGVAADATGRPAVVVVNAPGSPGGVRDAVAVLGPLVRHLVDQLDGGDHEGGNDA